LSVFFAFLGVFFFGVEERAAVVGLWVVGTS
jgi:hypothetical protein